jgi:hypothetical protein
LDLPSFCKVTTIFNVAFIYFTGTPDFKNASSRIFL